MSQSWQTHAQQRGDTYHHFGPPNWCAQHDGDGVVAVELVEDELGPYYGWLDLDTVVGPVCVGLGYQAMLRSFKAGGPPDEDPVRDQEAGRGRIVRLRVRELRAAGAR